MFGRRSLRLLWKTVLVFINLVIVQSGPRFYSQHGAPWNLARIAHRQSYLRYSYIYDAHAGNNVFVYVIDSGIFTKHEEFATERAILGRNFVSKEPNDDLHGHGTAIASIIAGRKYGVAKRAKVVSVKVTDKYGRTFIGDVVGAVNYAVSQANLRKQRAIINVGLSKLPSKELTDAVDRAVRAGYLVVVPAGDANEDACHFSPANSNFALTVAGLDKNDRPLLSNYGRCVDMFAPGVDIKTAGLGIDLRNRSYLAFGSDYAAAHVAGVAAVYLSADPRLKPEKLIERIMNFSQHGVIRQLHSDTPNVLLYNRKPITN